MNRTHARARFKEHFGHANQYLVTSLVALYCLDNSSIQEAPPELHTSWGPRNKVSTIARSRAFLLQSFLGSAVDSIDMYISLLNRKPNCLQNLEISSRLDGAGRSVLRKVIAIAGHCNVKPATLALIDVLITWRNNVLHELADNTVQDTTIKALAECSDEIQYDYRNLDATQLSEKARKGAPLTFKETASLINATHNFVQEVDSAVIAKLDLGVFCIEAVSSALNDKDQSTGFADKYYRLSLEKRTRFLRNWLTNKWGVIGLPDEALREAILLKRG